ncbi:hypothetical protein KIL84_011404, partial [Mauremys mutica]
MNMPITQHSATRCLHNTAAPRSLSPSRPHTTHLRHSGAAAPRPPAAHHVATLEIRVTGGRGRTGGGRSPGRGSAWTPPSTERGAGDAFARRSRYYPSPPTHPPREEAAAAAPGRPWRRGAEAVPGGSGARETRRSEQRRGAAEGSRQAALCVAASRRARRAGRASCAAGQFPAGLGVSAAAAASREADPVSAAPELCQRDGAAPAPGTGGAAPLIAPRLAPGAPRGLCAVTGAAAAPLPGSGFPGPGGLGALRAAAGASPGCEQRGRRAGAIACGRSAESKGLVDRNSLLLCVCQSSLALSAILWLLLPAFHNNATDQSYCIPPPMLAYHPDGCKSSEK